MTGESQNCVIINGTISMLTFGALKIFYEKRQRSLINYAVFYVQRRMHSSYTHGKTGFVTGGVTSQDYVQRRSISK